MNPGDEERLMREIFGDTPEIKEMPDTEEPAAEPVPEPAAEKEELPAVTATGVRHRAVSQGYDELRRAFGLI